MPQEPIDLVLSVTVETKENTVEVPIDDENALQVRSEGVYLDGILYFWEDIICVLIVNKGGKQ